MQLIRTVIFGLFLGSIIPALAAPVDTAVFLESRELTAEQKTIVDGMYDEFNGNLNLVSNAHIYHALLNGISEQEFCARWAELRQAAQAFNAYINQNQLQSKPSGTGGSPSAGRTSGKPGATKKAGKKGQVVKPALKKTAAKGQAPKAAPKLSGKSGAMKRAPLKAVKNVKGGRK